MKTKMALPDAERIARRVLAKLAPLCQRIEIAGSIRRRKREVGDIEIVCVPNFVPDMFGKPSSVSVLDSVDWNEYGELKMNGPKQKKIILPEGIQLDLFIVTPPAQWGWIFLLRTGSAEYSRKMVTPRNKNGFLPGYIKAEEGALWSHNHTLPTPEEKDVYDLFGLEFTPPHLRK